MRTAFFSIFWLITLTLIYSSCIKKELCPNGNSLGSNIVSELYLGDCYSLLDTPYFVANSESDYYEVLRSLADTKFIDTTLSTSDLATDLRKMECDSIYFPQIDFDRYSVIGLRTDGVGCSVTSDIELTTTGIAQHIFKVTVHECGSCNFHEFSMNWVKVLKIKRDDQVRFILQNSDSTFTLGEYIVE